MKNNEILMPALSPTMEEGTLAKWLVKVGDKISSGDLIAEIETDKATMEIEAVEDGFISKLMVEEGTQGHVTSATGDAGERITIFTWMASIASKLDS